MDALQNSSCECSEILVTKSNEYEPTIVGMIPRLMEHVRLPLVSLEYITKKVVENLFLKIILNVCKSYINEALNFHKLKTQQIITIPQTTRSTPRLSGHKVVLVLCFSLTMKKYSPCALALLKEHFVVFLGDECGSRTVEVLDLSSKSYRWISMVGMLVSRECLGVGVIDNYLYAVGGYDGTSALKSVEYYDPNINTWTSISEMSIRRFGPGVGVLNGGLYFIGGHNGHIFIGIKKVSRLINQVLTFGLLLLICTHIDSIQEYYNNIVNNSN
ncbi:hypothetical protein AGLY_005931 [Aphis glycines]|uniref:BACK domain-containing protein n=1 Tax=Aphis glycines TaxID=307491 RepID=A0A6G0TTK7_APHGL|nr:hypothetical protein AGLY_005931 [Aphis glycines]